MVLWLLRGVHVRGASCIAGRHAIVFSARRARAPFLEDACEAEFLPARFVGSALPSCAPRGRIVPG
eukprot:10023033-Alexandrium_andersonii.AAC.1